MDPPATATHNASGLATHKRAKPKTTAVAVEAEVLTAPVLFPMRRAATATQTVSGIPAHKRADLMAEAVEAEAEAEAIIVTITTMMATKTLIPHCNLYKTAKTTLHARGEAKKNNLGRIQDLVIRILEMGKILSMESALVLEAEEEAEEAEAEAGIRAKTTTTQKAARPTQTTFARGIQLLIHRATPAKEVEMVEMEVETRATLTIRQFLLSRRHLLIDLTAPRMYTGVHGQEI